MSMMNCSAALQAALDQAAQRMNNLMVIHVDPDAADATSGRRLSLPLSSDAQLAFALGCAQAGLRPVLDLTALRDAPQRLQAAFAALPRASRRPLVIRVAARRCPALPGVRVIAPANARECAGAMRFALQADLISVIVENPLIAYEACEVPDEPEELFSGAPLPEETPPEPPAVAPVETAESPAEPEPAPAPLRAMACRIRPYDPAGLTRVAALLGRARGELAALCCAKAGRTAQVDLETDAALGETACLPPEAGGARLWVGCDRLALCWDPGALPEEEARSLLRETAALLETPERLILERDS
ncbi:MAG: hypothetical protein IKO07_13510 [Clostridia bacterium]|nr:hypothetical protein [Clostridia bacterium]